MRFLLLELSQVTLAACGPISETELQKAIEVHDAVAVEHLLAAEARPGGPGAVAIRRRISFP